VRWLQIACSTAMQTARPLAKETTSNSRIQQQQQQQVAQLLLEAMMRMRTMMIITIQGRLALGLLVW
jgi:hypothetical protein